MKLKDYVRRLNIILEQNPEYGEYNTIYSHDDEGNGYQEMSEPDPEAIGYFDPDEYVGDMSFKYHTEEWEDAEQEVNAICIN